MGRAAKREAVRGCAERVAPRPPADLLDLRFRRLMGEAAWAALPDDTRRRFGRRLHPGEAVDYRGVTEATRTNAPGRLLTQLSRLIGAPLPLPGIADGGAAVVTVTEAAEGHGQFWTRQYARADGFPQVVHSAKGFGGRTGLEEVVGGGLGMALTLRAADGVLLFESDGFFVRAGGRRLPLPRALTPRLTVGHEDLGGGAFAFAMDLTHPLFGTLMTQRCRFTETARAREGDAR